MPPSDKKTKKSPAPAAVPPGTPPAEMPGYWTTPAEHLLGGMTAATSLTPDNLQQLLAYLQESGNQLRIPPRWLTTHALTLPPGGAHSSTVPVDFRVETTDPDLKHQIALYWRFFFAALKVWPAIDEPIYTFDRSEFVSTAPRWVADKTTVAPALTFGEYVAVYFVEDVVVDQVVLFGV